jgi:hypothetical protein
MKYRDMHGNELRAGDRIRFRDGRVYTLCERTFHEGCGVKNAGYGGRTRLCLHENTVSEPYPHEWVVSEGIEKI